MYKNVSTKHPKYNNNLELWNLIEDCIFGEKTIKDAGEKYLPRPSGMANDLEGNKAYKNYITRAHFPDFTSKFLSGLTGVTKINPPKITLPDKLEYLKENADGDGTPLDVFFFQSIRLALKTGRQLIFVDVDQENNRLKLVRYNAKELVNWGNVKKTYNDKSADFYVLEEMINTSDDIFTHEYEEQYRVLTTLDILSESDSYFTSVLCNKEGDLIEEVTPSLTGKKFKGLPVVIIGSTDIGVEIDQIPLLGVSKCAIQIYMKDADLSNAMFLTCNPTLVISGVTAKEDESSEVLIGSNVSITLENPESKVYYTKTDSSGIAEVGKAKKTYLEEAKHAGSALLSNEQTGVESGEALRIKSASTSASLSTVSQSVARGFEKAIRYMAKWININEEEVNISVDTDYLDNMMTPDVVRELISLFEKNVITHETILNKLIEGKFLDEDFDVKKELKEIQKKSESSKENLSNESFEHTIAKTSGPKEIQELQESQKEQEVSLDNENNK